MKFLTLRLRISPAESARLHDLQVAFAEVCNFLAPLARDTRCWNRVALHHMAYRSLRERFPRIGSQMACNAIYSVSRTCRLVYQSPNSPFNLARTGSAPLALIRFADQAPVYFDRHTLNLKDGTLSMFTLDGRMKFSANLAPGDEARFRTEKLLEVMLFELDGAHHLSFRFADTEDTPEQTRLAARESESGALPSYVHIIPGPADIAMRSHP